MIFDHSKLIGKIKELYPNRKEFVALIPLSSTAFSNKINNKTRFVTNEIYKIVEILGIDAKDIDTYFFTIKVEKVQ